MMFQDQMKFQEKSDDLWGELFSIDEQQLKRVRHGQLFHHLPELP
jgi:hypothetical protein